MATDQERLEKVAREIYGPYVKDAVVLAASAVGQMRQRLDAMDRERAALAAEMSRIEAGFTRLTGMLP